MKRLHVHVAVDDLQKSIAFYSTLFAAEPAVVKPDYAKWMLDDPRVNFAISARGNALGVDHLGIQVESKNELGEVYERLERAQGPVLEEGETTCCYAKSEKSWIMDPQGIAWETFHTTGESTVYGHGVGQQLAQLVPTARPAAASAQSATSADSACCGPSTAAAKPATVSAKCCG
ncbi:MAG TPA: ArsI/CadI family heavy metal resistance metalloenzyme [Stellaceae bacterium]|nr:ArsI/CadI family heavy metal resistance metalloenzyme [Stellaceae bacterium]